MAAPNSGKTDLEPIEHGPKRPQCARCQRPRAHCLCPLIPQVQSNTRVLVIQHPSEARHALNTGRLLALGLLHAELVITERLEPQIEEMLMNPEWRTELLFPGEEAGQIRSVCDSEKPRRLVLLDGTWRKARKLLYLNPVLQALPQIVLPGDMPSRYRLRKAPNAAALSTVEAGVAALSIIEPEVDFSDLLRPFDALIEGQIAAMGYEQYERNHLKPRPCPD